MSSPALSGQQTGGGGNTRYWAANTDQHLSRSPRCPQSSTSGIAGTWVTPSHSGTLSHSHTFRQSSTYIDLATGALFVPLLRKTRWWWCQTGLTLLTLHSSASQTSLALPGPDGAHTATQSSHPPAPTNTLHQDGANTNITDNTNITESIQRPPDNQQCSVLRTRTRR